MADACLPFTIRVVRGDNALQNAVTIRQTAYGRHVSEFAAKLNSPEPKDHDRARWFCWQSPDWTASSLGTMRIQTYRHSDLAIER